MTSRPALFLATFLGLVAWGSLIWNYPGPDLSPDPARYYDIATSFLVQNQLPYRDFLLEYPPLALVPMVVPELLNLGLGNSWLGYEVILMTQNILVALVTGWLVGKVNRSGRWTYALTVLPYSLLVLERYDGFVALLTTAGVVAVLRDKPGWTGLWFGLGVTAKLYPIVLVPVCAAYYLGQGSRRKSCQLVVVALTTILGVCLPWLFLAGPSFFTFLTYQTQRGLQLETVVAGLLALGENLGWTRGGVVGGYGSQNLVSPLAQAWVTWLPWLAAAALIGAWVWSWQKFSREFTLDRRITVCSLVVALSVTILVFILMNKVLSPQYLIWLIPCLALLPPYQAALFWGIGLLTTLVYPYFYGQLIDQDLGAVLLLNARNLLLVVLLGWLVTCPSTRLRT